ncbi:HU family DNA-binding protein [Cardinium endosymbiont of Tipula unca]|uniref:HU family DNA-binding protein n=1 Tax=Cardinium endosymbiont of Tipula unca TaxID=3066216 RepID=UPI0030CD6FB3
MTKSEVILAISRKTRLNKENIKATIDELMSIIQQATVENKRVYFSGFGSFFKKKRAQKIGRNINKNEAMVVEERYIPCFQPSKVFKEEIKASG